MKLKEIAHSRTGDKGEISNISVIPYREEDFDFLKEVLTAEKVKEYFSEICHGSVTRYELEGIKAFNFVLDKALGGGVTRSLALDKHGKTLGMALLEMEIPEREADTEKRFCPMAAGQAEKEYTPAGRTIRIGSGAGYAGDRLDAAVELMEKGNLDYIIFECLAERTIALGQKEKLKNPWLQPAPGVQNGPHPAPGPQEQNPCDNQYGGGEPLCRSREDERDGGGHGACGIQDSLRHGGRHR